MWMGQAFIVDTQQSEPRGGDMLYSVNNLRLFSKGKRPRLIETVVSLRATQPAKLLVFFVKKIGAPTTVAVTTANAAR